MSLPSRAAKKNSQVVCVAVGMQKHVLLGIRLFVSLAATVGDELTARFGYGRMTMTVRVNDWF